MSYHADLSRSLWDGCLNARDIGGYPAKGGVTRYGVLYRSDNLCRLSERGLEAFAATGVGTIVDLRSAYELDIDPSPFATSATVRYLNLPLQNEDDAGAMAQINSDIRLSDMYRVMLRHFGANLAAIFEAVAQSDGAVVLHCHAGKDRTGLVVSLLLAAVGVTDEAVAADYAASADYLHEAVAERLRHAKPAERKGLTHKLGAESATMLCVLEWLRSTYGGAEAYLEAGGVSETTLARLREQLVARS